MDVLKQRCDNTALLLWLGSGLVSVRKGSCVGLKYLLRPTQTQLEMSPDEGVLKDTRWFRKC